MDDLKEARDKVAANLARLDSELAGRGDAASYDEGFAKRLGGISGYNENEIRGFMKNKGWAPADIEKGVAVWREAALKAKRDNEKVLNAPSTLKFRMPERD